MSNAFISRFIDVLWHVLPILWVGSAVSLAVMLPLILTQVDLAPMLADSVLRTAWLVMVGLVWVAVPLQVVLCLLVKRLQLSVWALQCLGLAVVASAVVVMLNQGAQASFWLRYSTWVVALAGIAFAVDIAHKKGPQ